MPQTYRRHSEVPPRRPPDFEFVGGNGSTNPNPRPSYVTRRASGIPAIPQPPPASQPPVAPPAITDADDSIVLSDLIRTGETSRLRRRGAMRLDHASRPLSAALLASYDLSTQTPQPSQSPQQQQQQQQQQPRPIFVSPSRSSSPVPPMYMPTGGDDEYTYGGQEWREWATEGEGGMSGPVYAGAGPLGPGGMQLEDFRHTERDPNEQAYMLFCGGPVSNEHHHSLQSQSSQTPFKPSVLPGFPSATPSPSQRPTTRSGADAPHTNGCGALIHLRAFPQKPRPVWVGKEEATDVVVSLESHYFESTVVAKMMKSACGCVREGIGCAVCGNPLGTRYMPCQAASEGIFSVPTTSSTTPSTSTPASSRPSSLSRPTRSSRPLHPSSPRYWNCRPTPSRSRTWASSSPLRSDKRISSSSSNPKRFYVYTFFADRVNSAPAQDGSDSEDHADVPSPVTASAPPPFSSSRRPPLPTRSQTIYPPPRALDDDPYDDDDGSSPPPLPASFLALTSPSNRALGRSFTASPRPISPPSVPVTRPVMVPPPIQFLTGPVNLGSPAPRTQMLEDDFDTRMRNVERGGRDDEEMVLDADGVVVVDDDEEGGETGDGDKGVGEGMAWGGR
ncbi:hypothetical protein EIP91_003932 [Steccherinum ochraceum]|uniref:Uncharacterized protein n=1 Tax=Steccherinum ochraceum TaxID=92696 RepID=A0A4R0RSM0_9APHY|nr:hypothetical protein EIP91_003932 [Steccherinum ochraceum]